MTTVKLISEQVQDVEYITEEKEDGKKNYKIKGVFMQADIKNRNGRVYPMETLQKEVGRYNKEYIKESACALNIEDLIHSIGFVENNEIPFLYKQAIALVMPTYFGPTNIPPFEASLYKCPILYSDLPGLRDQMENKALFLDLLNPKSLALNLNKVLNNDEDIQSIVQHAYDSIQSFDKSLHWNKLKVIFDQYKILQKTWKA